MEIVWFALIILVGALAWGFIKGYAGTPSGSIGKLHGPGHYGIEVVGESHYQRDLENICGGRSEDGAEKYVEATLILEDSNPHDRKAVRIDIQGKTVGYLSRELAHEYRKRLTEAGHNKLTGVCNAVIRGGWDRGGGNRGHFGVWLDLPTS